MVELTFPSTFQRPGCVNESTYRLEEAIARYHNRSVDALQILQELIALAKDLRNEPDDGLDGAERAFYDALAQNESSAQVMSNQELRVIATELVTTVCNNSGVDW
ncbi:hypothetical protein CFBP6411_01422 [Pseudomonas syringae group genomosp. 3]|uniref:Type I restriction enzyme HindI endonuclease subunit-like C-terminal domain-containing protein n=1 Tax=Pseudomonas syringae group genomosp. 3 TaxID=251701 RepID=A0A2K4WA73_9PSED|nr:hypothetical protein CFBP6411_01422 [Pseudomonas syringae group genomosp. 3]